MEIGACCISSEVRQSPKAVKDGCRGAMEMVAGGSMIGIKGIGIGFEKEEDEEEEGDVEEYGGKFSGLRFGGGGEGESCH